MSLYLNTDVTLRFCISHGKKFLCFNFFFNCRSSYIFGYFPFSNILKYDECRENILSTYIMVFIFTLFGVSFRCILVTTGALGHSFPSSKFWLILGPHHKVLSIIYILFTGRNWSQSKFNIFSQGVSLCNMTHLIQGLFISYWSLTLMLVS